MVDMVLPGASRLWSATQAVAQAWRSIGDCVALFVVASVLLSVSSLDDAPDV
jgi:hypothetical protein